MRRKQAPVFTRAYVADSQDISCGYVVRTLHTVIATFPVSLSEENAAFFDTRDVAQRFAAQINIGGGWLFN